MIKDFDVRNSFKQKEINAHLTNPDCILIEELKIRNGLNSADLVLVNGIMDAYELKSEADTLKRLTAQRGSYDLVFDKCNLVVCRQHRRLALRKLTPWWGICILEKQGNALVFNWEREALFSPRNSAVSIVSLLRKEEAIDVCVRHGLGDHDFREKRWTLWNKISENLSIATIKAEVRSVLKSRSLKSGLMSE